MDHTTPTRRRTRASSYQRDLKRSTSTCSWQGSDESRPRLFATPSERMDVPGARICLLYKLWIHSWIHASKRHTLQMETVIVMVYRLCNFVALSIDHNLNGCVFSQHNFSHHGDGVHTVTFKVEIWQFWLLGHVGGLDAANKVPSDNWISSPKFVISCVHVTS